MKIEINNFGPIHHFTFDLDKDLHILYGKNSIGKSYAISVVYLILKSFLEGEYYSYDNDIFKNELSNKELHLNSIFGKIYKSINQINREPFSIKEEYEAILPELFLQKNGPIEYLKNALNNSFDLLNTQNKFSKERSSINIDLYFETISLSFDVQGNILVDLRTKRNLIIDIKDIDSVYIRGEGEVGIKLYEKTIKSDKFENEVLSNFVKFIFNCLHSIEWNYSKFSKIYFLPASRSGLYEGMNIFSSLLVQLSQSRHNLTQKIEIPALPIPTSDYLLNISTIKKHQPTGVYAELAAKIEQKILNAEVLFNNDNKKLEYYNKEIDLKLDIGETSSMISEVAPIVAHLKYILKEDKEKSVKILFIEEPEAHLHPEVQIALMEIFAEMTQHNIKIILTTHSNYIFNKVNNMILNETIAADQLGVHHLIMTDKGSIQNPNIFDAVTGIIDENFVETTQKLYQERLDATD